MAQKWLLAHPPVQLHFTPTYSSWISQVERWFAELQRRCLDRRVFCSLDELTAALENRIKTWTRPPGRATLLGPADLEHAVVAVDAAHARRESTKFSLLPDRAIRLSKLAVGG